MDIHFSAIRTVIYKTPEGKEITEKDMGSKIQGLVLPHVFKSAQAHDGEIGVLSDKAGNTVFISDPHKAPFLEKFTVKNNELKAKGINDGVEALKYAKAQILQQKRTGSLEVTVDLKTGRVEKTTFIDFEA